VPGKGVHGGDTDFNCPYYNTPAAIVNDNCSVCQTPITRNGEHGSGGERPSPAEQHTAFTQQQLKQLELDQVEVLEGLIEVINQANRGEISRDIGKRAQIHRSHVNKRQQSDRERIAVDEAQTFLEGLED
jgi:hypothetical protein